MYLWHKMILQMDTCVTVNVNIGGQNSFSLTQTIDKSEHLKSLGNIFYFSSFLPWK